MSLVFITTNTPLRYYKALIATTMSFFTYHGKLYLDFSYGTCKKGSFVSHPHESSLAEDKSTTG
jgi:hypothetical protein